MPEATQPSARLVLATTPPNLGLRVERAGGFLVAGRGRGFPLEGAGGWIRIEARNEGDRYPVPQGNPNPMDTETNKRLIDYAACSG